MNNRNDAKAAVMGASLLGMMLGGAFDGFPPHVQEERRTKQPKTAAVRKKDTIKQQRKKQRRSR